MDNNLNQQPQVVYVQQPVQQNPWKQPGRIKGLIFSIVSLNCGITAIVMGLLNFFMDFVFLTLATVSSPYNSQPGITESIFFIVYYGIFTAIYAIPGIIFGVLAKKVAPFKMASAGIGLSIAGIVMAVLSIILSFVTIAF